MSPTSRSPRRLAALTVTAACAVAALGAGSAVAAPISGSASGHAEYGAIPTGGKIAGVTSSVDPVTGVWTTAVTFDAPQTAQAASALRVGLLTPDRAKQQFGFTTDTDPDHLGGAPASADYLSPTYGGSAGAVTSMTYDPTRTVLTLTATDPGLVGYTPDYVRVTTADRGGGTEFSVASVYLGEVAPVNALPAKSRQLTASRGGVIHVPLNALRTKADRRVLIRLHGQVLGLKTLPEKYSGRREAIIRLSKTGLRRLGSGNRTVVLEVGTALDNTSKAYAYKTVKLRRR